MKGKTFADAKKQFISIIDKKNKMIKYLESSRDKLLADKYILMNENDSLRKQLDYANNALHELSAINDLSPGDIKVLVNKAIKMNDAIDIITGKVMKELTTR